MPAILANGGYMPADPAAFGSVFKLTPGYSNSVVVADPALRPLTDIFALPAAFPLANVFSIGDVLIGIGLVLTIAIAMRTGARPAGAAGSCATPRSRPRDRPVSSPRRYRPGAAAFARPGCPWRRC